MATDTIASGGCGPDTVQHLTMIQAVIARMGTNSFSVKTWAVGLITAVFALATAPQAGRWLALVGLLPATVFWYLDAFYLREERLFRRLYDAVRTGDNTVAQAGPFGMSTAQWSDEETLLDVAVSRTIAPLYGSLALLVVAVALRRG